MWTLRQVYAKNLCAFKQLDYTLLQKHTTLILATIWIMIRKVQMVPENLLC